MGSSAAQVDRCNDLWRDTFNQWRGKVSDAKAIELAHETVREREAEMFAKARQYDKERSQRRRDELKAQQGGKGK